jgi:hypothetical protein
VERRAPCGVPKSQGVHVYPSHLGRKLVLQKGVV